MQKRTVILFSALVGLVALIGGLLGIAQRSATYEATAKILIVPTTTDDGLSISGADTLSRGPVASTFSEAYSSSQVVSAALREAGIGESEAAEVSVTTTVITDTSALSVVASSSSPVLAERAANAVSQARPDLGGYSVAFRAQQIGTADGTASRSGPGTGTLVLIAIMVSGALALATAAVLGRIVRFPGFGPDERPTSILDDSEVPETSSSPRPSRTRRTRTPSKPPKASRP